MHLVGREQPLRRQGERCRHAAAVLGHPPGGIARAGAAIKARINAVGDAARAREEGVADAVNVRKSVGL